MQMSAGLNRTLLVSMAFLAHLAALAGNYAGKVVDEAGSPLAGAVIRIADKTAAVLTGGAGVFRFELPGQSSASISVSYIGFVAESAVVKADRSIKENTVRLSWSVF